MRSCVDARARLLLGGRRRGVGLDVGEHLSVVRSSETRDGIPSGGGREAVGAAERLGALVVSDGDVLVVGGVGLVHLVEERVEEAERGLAVVEQPVVPERDHAADDGARARGAVDELPSARDVDEVVVAEGRDVGEAAVGRVKVLRRRQADGGRKVGGDLLALPRGHGAVVREASARGDERVGERARDLGPRGIGAVELRADRRGGGGLEARGRARRREHGGADRGDPRRGAREDGRDGLGRVLAVGVVVARSALVARGGEQRHAAEADLLPLGVGALHVLLRRVAVAARDLALRVLGPAPAHRHDERHRVGVIKVVGELEQPAIDRPEPHAGVDGDRTAVLHVERRLGVGHRRLVRADNVRDRHGRQAVLRLEAREIRGRERAVVLELGEAHRAVGVGGVRRVHRNAVVGRDHVRNHLAGLVVLGRQRLVHERLANLLGARRRRERRNAANELGLSSNQQRQRVRANLTNNANA